MIEVVDQGERRERLFLVLCTISYLGIPFPMYSFVVYRHPLHFATLPRVTDLWRPPRAVSAGRLEDGPRRPGSLCQPPVLLVLVCALLCLFSISIETDCNILIFFYNG